MMESMSVVEVNPHLFVQRIVEAIKDGYYVYNTNSGWVTESHLKEINLFRNPEKVFPEKELGEFVINERNTQNFLSLLCDWVGVGAQVNLDSLYWDDCGFKRIEGKLYLPAEYTKEQLNDLGWEEFKEVVKAVVGTGRHRDTMTTKYLQATGQAQ